MNFASFFLFVQGVDYELYIRRSAHIIYQTTARQQIIVMEAMENRNSAQNA